MEDCREILELDPLTPDLQGFVGNLLLHPVRFSGVHGCVEEFWQAF